MSVKSQLWEKFKKSYHSRGESSKHKVYEIKQKELNNSCSDTSLLLENPFNHLHIHTNREKVKKSKKEHICHVCDNSPRNNCGSCSETAKLNLEYIDNLVQKIKELKNRVRYIENHCTCGTDQNQREHKQIGDYDPLKWQNSQKQSKYKHGGNSSNVTLNDDLYKYKFINFPDQKSIYTANEHTLQETYYKVSKNQKNKSNASLHSTSKNNFLKVSPHPDAKQFQAAAEEFIQQAEELKGKIGYILECCGCNQRSANPSEKSIVPSEHNRSVKSSGKERPSDPVSNRDLKFLLGTVTTQYSEILTSLVSIEQQIHTLNKEKLTKPAVSSNESMYIPKTIISNDKVGTHKFRKSNSAALKACVSEDPNKLSHYPTKKHSTELKSSYLKARKNSRPERNLEPVVMVYEPILPDCDVATSIGTCKYCGQDLSNCDGCDGDLKIKPKKGSSKYKREEEKTEKYGFVVTYTPDMSFDVNVTPSSSEASTKTKMKERKKIIPCLWF